MMAACSYSVWFYKKTKNKYELFTEQQTKPIFPTIFLVQPTEILFIFSPYNLRYSISAPQHSDHLTLHPELRFHIF